VRLERSFTNISFGYDGENFVNLLLSNEFFYFINFAWIILPKLIDKYNVLYVVPCRIKI